MMDVAKLEALLARVGKNRRPAPPSLESVLRGLGGGGRAEAQVASARPEPAAKMRAPTPMEQALAAPRHAPAEPEIEVVVEEVDEAAQTGEFAEVHTGEVQITDERMVAREAQERAERERAEREAREREAQERAEREAQERAEREAREREARERAEREAQERAEREARERAEREAQERAEREARERAEREAQERAEREARERAEREAQERAERETPPQASELLAVAASASGPVARLTRPLDESAPTFGRLMQRTLALRPRG